MRHIRIIILLLIMFVCTTTDMRAAMPFLRNYSALDYKAHSRNFDVLCCKDGRVLVANFEGLLMFDGARWQIIHSPAISRITKLYSDSKGTIWFGGHNLLGTVSISDHDSIAVRYITSDEDNTFKFDEITQLYEKDGSIHFHSNDNIYKVSGKRVYKIGKVTGKENIPSRLSINIPDANITVTATEKNGLKFSSIKGTEEYTLNNDNGLCSNSITAIDYDGMGTLWGATANGIFQLSVTKTYTRYGELDGLHGEVTCVQNIGSGLFVGTMIGLYKRVNYHFEKLGAIHQACWHLAATSHNTVLASTPEGVFECGSSIRQLTNRHTLYTFPLPDGSFYSCEVEGIYLHHPGGKEEKLSDASNVTELKIDEKGDIWAQNLFGEVLKYQEKGKIFTTANDDQKIFSRLLEYTSPINNWTWRATNHGNGISLANADAKNIHIISPWLQPLNEHIVRCAFDEGGALWLGGAFGLIRFDYKSCTNKLERPKVIIRNYRLNGRELQLFVSLDRYYPLGEIKYSYQLNEGDSWSAWDDDNDFDIPNLNFGNHIITVKARDVYGNIVMSEGLQLYVPFPIFLKWYFVLLYLITIATLIYLIYRWRTQRILKENAKLESEVAKRTQQVVQQKEEIEKQADQLKETLSELERTQHELIRKEHEATVGKLTKGLIDRILNPMNYINNFSHLTLGLVKDLNEDLEDEKDAMSEDNYEDCMDIADMMQQNLEKIEEHGLATTRILKSMEEMLRDRSAKPVLSDVAALCQQAYEMLLNYFDKDIKTLGVNVVWEKPQQPIMANITPDYLSKSIMSMINNSFHALRLKHAKGSKDLAFTLAVNELDDEIQIKLHDTGIGIEESIIDKIFDPFFTTKPTAEASGVGLYLTQQIVQDFGGRVTATSRKYEYTEFIIHIPRP